MKTNCTICNNNFILTYDWDIIDNDKSLYESKDCLKCNKSQKEICSELLKALNKEEPVLNKEEPVLNKVRNKKRGKNKWKQAI